MALSATVIEAERVPAIAGLKVTEIVQLAPAATLVPHVLVWLKSDGLVPVSPMLVIVRAALPVFETAMVWAALVVPRFWLVNVRVEGLSEACGTATPVPLRLIVCGLLPPLSLMDTSALRVPVTVGWNVMVRVQLPFEHWSDRNQPVGFQPDQHVRNERSGGSELHDFGDLRTGSSGNSLCLDYDCR